MSESKELKPVDALKKTVQAMAPQFKSALPTHINPDKFSRVVMTAISNNADLVNADRSSFFSACMKAAQDGLLPDGREAAFVTFKTKNGVVAQYMPMVAGILKKVRNSGELASITSQLVYRNDAFRFWVDGDGEHLVHEPNMWDDRGELIGVYALAKTKDGDIYVEVMTKKEVEDVKNSSRAKDFGPWAGAFETEMWRKTAIRRLSKRLPMSTDLEDAVKRDDELYEFTPEAKDVTPAEPKKAAAPTGPSKLKGLLAKKEEAPEVREVSPEKPEGEPEVL